MKKTIQSLLFSTLISFLLAACSSVSLNGAWKDPDYDKQIKTVYIVSVAQDEAHRRIFEDDMRKKLEANGVKAITSYHDLPASKETDKNAIERRAKADGADAILVARVIGERLEQVVNPGKMTTYDSGRDHYGAKEYYSQKHHQDYGSFYSHSTETIYEPSTTTTFEVATLEANLYDVSTEQLVWAAQMEVVVDYNFQEMIEGFVTEIDKDLKVAQLY